MVKENLIAPHILWEDDVILVVNKPAGLMVEPDRNGHPNVQQEVKRYLKQKNSSADPIYAQHIHRLDRPVSGVLLFAIQRTVLQNLSEQFAQRNVAKFYQALTENAPQQTEGVLEHWHRKEKKLGVVYTEEQPYSERARLSYKSNLISPNRCHWNIQLHTGKFHQIRAQLASVGCPIVGDERYGSKITYKLNAIALHASALHFHHPMTNEAMVIEAPPNFN